MQTAFWTFVTAAALGQAPRNLDFAQGLDGWQGSGFSAAAAGLNVGAGASSQDADAKGAMVRQVFVVPATAKLLLFDAAAHAPESAETDDRIDVVLAGESNVPSPRLVRNQTGAWEASPRIEPPWLGRPRTYAWDVSLLAGQRVQVVLVDRDPRPGAHLWAGAFRFAAASALNGLDPDFVPFMVGLQRKHGLAGFSQYDSKRFTAISNASAKFTTQRLQQCEIFHDQFLRHFAAKGFSVTPPTQRLMVAVFDSHAGFDAYFGRKMAAGIAGVYHTPTNRLVLYDMAENRSVVANRDAAMKKGAQLGNASLRTKYFDTLDRKVREYAHDANLSTTMHECAHQIAYNCGLLERKSSSPAWLVEGMATYCEATDQGDWVTLGAVNPMRIHDLRRARGGLLSLAELVKDDAWLNGPKALVGYAESWLLFHILIHERPKQLRKYLDLVRERQAPEGRVSDFQEAFGSFAPIERRFRDAVHEMLDRVAPPDMR